VPHRRLVGLALAIALIAGLTTAAAPAAAAFNCDASALRASVLGGAAVEPVTANRGQSSCREARGGGANLLPAPLATSLVYAQTSLAGQAANASGGIADARVGPLGTLPVALPVEQAVEAVQPIGVPGVGQIDLRPALRSTLTALQNLDVLRLQAAVSYAKAACENGRPSLTGSSSVADLTVLGQRLPTDRAVTQAIQLLGSQTIDPSTLDPGQLLPPGVTLPGAEALVRQVLDTLPSIPLPPTVAEVRITPSTTTRAGSRLTQRALQVAVTVAGQPILDLVAGEASVAGTDADCAVAGGASSVSQAALQCTRRRLVLIDVLERRGRVRLLGAADRRYIGRTVDIVFRHTGRRVARTRVRRDGTFTTTAPLPPRSVRGTNRARYQARVGRERSMRLKLRRRLVVRSTRVRGRRVRIAGRVTQPLAAPARRIEVRRRESCKRWVVVKRIRPRRDGTFTTTVAAPAGQLAATYRFATRVRKVRRNPKTYPTFTLPRHVDLSR
jgi:hypothetical protein